MPGVDNLSPLKKTEKKQRIDRAEGSANKMNHHDFKPGYLGDFSRYERYENSQASPSCKRGMNTGGLRLNKPNPAATEAYMGSLGLMTGGGLARCRPGQSMMGILDVSESQLNRLDHSYPTRPGLSKIHANKNRQARIERKQQDDHYSSGILAPCPSGSPWHRVQGGYLCAHGDHILTDELLSKRKGACFYHNSYCSMGSRNTSRFRQDKTIVFNGQLYYGPIQLPDVEQVYIIVEGHRGRILGQLGTDGRTPYIDSKTGESNVYDRNGRRKPPNTDGWLAWLSVDELLAAGLLVKVSEDSRFPIIHYGPAFCRN